MQIQMLSRYLDGRDDGAFAVVVDAVAAWVRSHGAAFVDAADVPLAHIGDGAFVPFVDVNACLYQSIKIMYIWVHLILSKAKAKTKHVEATNHFHLVSCHLFGACQALYGRNDFVDPTTVRLVLRYLDSDDNDSVLFDWVVLA